MMYYQKPENALKRAKEFEAVNKPLLALEALDDLITSRRHKTWSKTHELIMIKYIDLCLLLGKGREAKDGLHKYKNIASATAAQSLETVINYFLEKAEERVIEASGEASRILADIEDLDAPDTPESVLLQAVTDEMDRQRTDRVVLTPWLKFLWEAYRTVLDILRNNAKLEQLYQATAVRAVKFCVDYERKSEFRRLCDLLRHHLSQVVKYQNQGNSIDLTSKDSLELHLTTRFSVLDGSIELKLWQEAYKAVEDISNLREVFKRPLDPRPLAMFFDKLAMVLLQSKDYAYHATTWHKLFSIHKEQRRSFSAQEAQVLASRVLLATLSIPPEAAAGTATGLGVISSDHQLEKQMRLCSLVGINTVPNRKQLVSELLAMNIMQYVDPELRDLYRWLEIEFHPLKLCSKVAPLMTWLSEHETYKAYVEPLQEIIMFRLTQQLSQVYETIQLKRLAELVDFANEARIERFVVNVVKQGLLKMQVCHRTRSITFGTNVFASRTEADGPRLQLLQSEMMRSQLTTLSKRLHQAVNMIEPTKRTKGLEERRNKVLEDINRRVTREHQAILSRKAIIERRKEYIEAQTRLKFQEETEKTQKQMQLQKEQEAERLQKEAEERKQMMQRKEVEELEKEQAMDRVKQLSKQIGQKLLDKLNITDITTMEPGELVRLQVEQLEKDSKDRQARQRANEKKLDYLERAKRVLEIPKIKQHTEDQRKGDQEWFAEQQRLRVEKSKQEHASNLALKATLQKVVPYKQRYCENIMAGRRQLHEEQLAAYKQEYARRRAQAEEDQRLEQERLEREAEEQRQREEEQRREDEERERQEEERRKQKAEEQKRLEEIEERKRAKEREIEERLERERQEAPRPGARYAPPGRDSGNEGPQRGPPVIARPGGGGGWREREKARTQEDGGGDRDGGRSYAPPARRDGGDRDRYSAPRRDEGGDRYSAPRRDEGGDRYSAPRRDDGGREDRPREIQRQIRRDGPRDGPRDDGGAWRSKADGGRDTREPRKEIPRRAQPEGRSSGGSGSDDWKTVPARR
eukprot:m.72993 g.72993  ORF g.72993 m.72993 type:complete len:1034 (+) comp14298_c0_seq2:137-3238(+)